MIRLFNYFALRRILFIEKYVHVIRQISFPVVIANSLIFTIPTRKFGFFGIPRASRRIIMSVPPGPEIMTGLLDE